MRRSTTEHRKAVRRQLQHFTWIVDDQGASIADCLLLDVSASGAQLKLEDPRVVPERFDLLLTADGRMRRHCEVVWRTQNRIGVRFRAS
jgi:hypothetical protein